MRIIVGLGNPGLVFKKTRHNLGFRVIDAFRRKNGFPKFKHSKKFKSLISEGCLERKKIITAKPQTFMNSSGRAVKSLVSGLKLQVSSLWVVHDDIDLSLGKIRISKGRGAAGHKGVQSIFDALNTKDFVRFRIGIQTEDKKQKTEEFVLQKFNKAEENILREVIKRTVRAIEIALREGIEKVMSNQ